MIDLTEIVVAVITLIGGIITAFLIPFLKSKLGSEKLQQVNYWVTVAVEAAEQVYEGSGRGAEKKAYVLEFLNKKGFTIDLESIDALIESAVHELE